MILRTYIPSYPLSEFVDSFLYYEGYTPVHSIDRFLPDGNTEVIFDLTDTPKYIYDNDALHEIQACHNVWASGVRTAPISIPSGKESRMLVIYFKKGKAYPFYQAPMNELTDHVVDADLLFGSNILSLREQLLSARSIPHMFRLIEHFLLRQGGTKLHTGPAAKCVGYAVSRIIQHPDIMNLRLLSSQIGYSQKHFIDLFRNQVGVSPKAYLRIMRFQKAILDIESKQDIRWSSLALESGYYDQAHFINDFKLFSGFTPVEYMQKKNGTLNYVPVG